MASVYLTFSDLCKYANVCLTEWFSFDRAYPLRAIKIALYAALGLDKGYTLHSLRRGAAQACQGSGLSLENIMRAGTWESKAVNSYLNSVHICAAPTVLVCWVKRCSPIC